jgi:hypothetical protein
MTESRADGAAAQPRMGRPGGLVDTPADPLAMVRSFAERGWGDGLPIVPATEERVTAMLSYSDRDPLEVLGVMSPRQGEVTRHALAVNAVMAGCEPSYFPVVVAAIEAILDPRFNIASLNATTHPVAMLVLVNGAIGRELRVHGGSGCFGPTFPANASIGRAVRLVLLNVGGASPGDGDRATQGTPAKFAFCFAENEEANPWSPYQTTQGFDANTSTVSVWGAEGPHNINDHDSDTGLDILRTIAGAMSQSGSNNRGGGHPLLALGPEHAATIAGDGLTREDVQNYLFEHARIHVGELAPWASRGVRRRLADEGREVTDEAVASYRLQIANSPEALHVVVAGGPGKHSVWMPTFGGATEAVTVPISDRDGRPLRSVRDLLS